MRDLTMAAAGQASGLAQFATGITMKKVCMNDKVSQLVAWIISNTHTTLLSMCG